MKLGCGYPMGPFTLLDFVGLDTTYYIANIMFDEYREPAFAPPPLLKRMVLAGHLGKKSGQGFYQYLATIRHRSEASRAVPFCLNSRSSGAQSGSTGAASSCCSVARASSFRPLSASVSARKRGMRSCSGCT